jgi:acyl dehydratase
MADVSKVGMSLPPYSLEVSRAKIKELVQAIGDDNPLFLDREAAHSAGHPDVPCPPTFLTLGLQEFSGAYLKAFKELGIALESVLHGEEEYEYLGEIYPGDILTGTMTFESIVEKQTKSGQMDLITLRTRFSNQRGEDVLRARSLIIERK